MPKQEVLPPEAATSRKGHTNNPNGRPAGVPNKMTSTLRKMILDSLEQAGGVDYLTLQAFTNPGADMALVGKVLPIKIAGDEENPLVVTVIERRIVKAMPRK